VANNIPFQAMGNTVVLGASSTSANVAITAQAPSNQFFIANPSANAVWVSIVANAANASINAPSAGNSVAGFLVLGGTARAYTMLQSSNTTTVYAAANAVSGTANIAITPGEGL